MPEDNTTFADRLNRTKEKMGELSKKAGEATKKATQATGDFLEKTSNQIQTAVEDTKSKIEEKKEQKIQDKKDAIVKDGLIGDNLSMEQLPPPSNLEWSNKQEQVKIITDLTEHVEILSKRCDELYHKTSVNNLQLEEIRQKQLFDEQNTPSQTEYNNPILPVFFTTAITLLLCYGVDIYLNNKNIMVLDEFPLSFISWGIGAIVWSYLVLHKVNQNIPGIDFNKGFRIKFSVIVGFCGFLSMFVSENPTFSVAKIWLWGTALVLITILSTSSKIEIERSPK